MSAFDAYVQAAFHGGTMSGGPTFTVVHDAETPLRAGYADSIAEFFRRGPTAGTSAHAMVDPVKAIKMLPDNVVAWAAGPKANTRGWHLEQAGYASFTRAQWTTADGLAQIRRAAACLREVHDTWGIPKRWVTDDQLRRAALGDRSSGGMTTHQQVTRALGGTTHTDPEERYPRDLLLQVMVGGSLTPTPLFQEDQDMRLIQQKDRGIAVVGPCYYKGLGPADVGVAVAMYGAPVIFDNAVDWDRAVSVATGGESVLDAPIQRNEQAGGGVTTLRAQTHWEDYNARTVIPEAVAKVVGTPQIDAEALASQVITALDGKVGLTGEDVEAALRKVLREGTGDPAPSAAA